MGRGGYARAMCYNILQQSDTAVKNYYFITLRASFSISGKLH